MKKRLYPHFDNVATHGKYRKVPFILYYHVVHDGPKQDFTAMRFYCAYIKIPYKHPWRRYAHMKWKQWDFFSSHKRFKAMDYDKINLNVHGGVTFATVAKTKDQYRWGQKFTKGPWIGWDYNHSGDQMWDLPTLRWQQPEIYKIEMKLMRDLGGPEAYERMHKKWRPEEVLADIYDAIDQMLRIKR